MDVKDRVEVTIPLDALARSTLEVGFRQLGFDQKITDAEICFGALDVICDKRNAGFVAELETLRRFSANQNAERTPGRKSLRVTEDIHKERIGTRRRVHFFSLRVMTYEAAPRRGVRLLKPTDPLGFSANAFVRCWMKVSMSPRFRVAE